MQCVQNEITKLGPRNIADKKKTSHQAKGKVHADSDHTQLF